MTRKILAKLILAGLALGGSELALACQLTNWTGGPTGSPVAGDPNDGVNLVRRYSGSCGLRANSTANYVKDNSPSAEPKYQVRFYVLNGVTAGSGEAVVFRATRASDSAAMIRVTYDTTANAFKFYVGPDNTPDGTATGAVDSAWYAIEINWSNASPAEMRYTVKGAGASAPLASANNVATSTAPSADHVIDTAHLGWVDSIGGPPTGIVTVDAFDSRRTSGPGRLCRGDADGAGNTRNSTDGLAIRNEFLSGSQNLAPGQPDCTEDGIINSTDGLCVRNIFLGGQGSCTNAI